MNPTNFHFWCQISGHVHILKKLLAKLYVLLDILIRQFVHRFVHLLWNENTKIYVPQTKMWNKFLLGTKNLPKKLTILLLKCWRPRFNFIFMLSITTVKFTWTGTTIGKEMIQCNLVWPWILSLLLLLWLSLVFRALKLDKTRYQSHAVGSIAQLVERRLGSPLWQRLFYFWQFVKPLWSKPVAGSQFLGGEALLKILGKERVLS